MNFLQLVNRLCVEAGASGSGPTTTVAQNGEYARMVNWINSAWLDIQSMHQDWGWLRTSASFQTVTGQGKYPLASMYNLDGSQGITNIGMWDTETFRNYLNPPVAITIASPAVVFLQSHGLSIGDTAQFYTTGALPTGLTAGVTYYVLSVIDISHFTLSAMPSGSPIATTGTQSGTHTMSSNNQTNFAGMRSEIFMDVISYDEWRDMYFYGALRSTNSRPMQFSVIPQDQSISVGPVPISGYTVTGDYFLPPSYLQNDTDIPALPSQWQMAIVYRAMQFYGKYEKDDGVIQYNKMECDKVLRQAMADRLPDVTFGPALA